MYLTGRGVSEDKEEAARLLARACDGGFATSLEDRKRACTQGLAAACQLLEQ